MQRQLIAIAAMCALSLCAACGQDQGRAQPPPTDSPAPKPLTLVSSVPAPNGAIDRWTPMHFTFSAPVSWNQVQFVTCVSGCRAPLVPYQFSGTGTEVVATPI